MTGKYQQPALNFFGTFPLSRLDGYPTPEMLFAENPPKLSENKINGCYANVAEYLDVQFNLILEDFVYPLRQALKNFKDHPQSRVFDGARVYRNVHLRKSAVELRRRTNFISCILDVGGQRYKEMPSFGSLLLFTRSNFEEDLLLGKVISDYEKSGVIEIELQQPWFHVERSSFTMMESKAFFYKYASILKALESFNESNFPLKEYIVYGRKEESYPAYIQRNTCYNVFGSTVYVAWDRQWPPCSSMQMDDSQRSALEYALTRKLAVVQGPPGTGKTHFGVRMVKVLLDNIQIWNPSGRTPLLVVCQSNAALDHFLEGLLKYTTRIIRVGEQSRSKVLKRYFLSHLADKYKELEPSIRMAIVRETVLQGAHVVGLTTTGASSRRDVLRALESPIVVVEEAAEVLEADVLASMTEHCQHLILLGDHKQLRPIVTTDHLGTDYNLDRSLFERLIISGVVKNSCLTTQYRMRPEISSLLKPHIYTSLDDAPSTLNRPPIRGLQKSMFFLHHERKERTSNGKTGFFNDHEATMLIHLAEYLVDVGYSPSQITIISMYLEQRNKLAEQRNKLAEERQNCDLKDLEIASVDSFQGKENDIILLSLVRNNEGGNIGFLKEENRACVALSRAKEGLFIMGNSKCLAKLQRHKNGRIDTVWTHVLERLAEKNAIGTELTLCCDKHNTSFKVSKIEHWNKKFCKVCRELMLEEPKKTEKVELLSSVQRQIQEADPLLAVPPEECWFEGDTYSSLSWWSVLILIFVIALLMGKYIF